MTAVESQETITAMPEAAAGSFDIGEALAAARDELEGLRLEHDSCVAPELLLETTQPPRARSPDSRISSRRSSRAERSRAHS